MSKLKLILSSSLLLIGSLTAYIAKKSNLLAKLTYSKTSIQGGKLVYLEIQSSPKQITQKFTHYYKKLLKNFKKVRPIIISYDSENSVQDQNKYRFIIGFIIDDFELNIEDKIDDFLGIEKVFRYKELHDFQVYGTEWPINTWALFSVQRAFKGLKKYVEQVDRDTSCNVDFCLGVWQSSSGDQNNNNNVICGIPFYCDKNHLDFCSIPKYEKKSKTLFIEQSQ